MKEPYHVNSKRGIVLRLMREVQDQATVLSTHDISLLLMIAYPKKAISNYGMGTLLSRTKEVERVSPPWVSPARWRLKEEEE